MRLSVMTCFLVVLSPVCLAETNAMSNEITSYVDGEDWVMTLLQEQGEVRYYMIATWRYPDYNANPMYQDIQNFVYSYNPAISFWEEGTDVDGNTYRESYWGTPNDDYPGTIEDGWYDVINTFSAILTATLDGMPSMTAFPIPSGSIPPEVQRYLQPGTYTQSDEAEILNHANSLVTGCTSQYEAVCKIIDWCRDELTYEAGHPVDALWVFQDPTHRAICSGYSHMAVALLRAVGIPARYVGGFAIDDPFRVPIDSGDLWFAHGQGTHAWLEVYYPDTGWIPYDAQFEYHYVDTHVYKRCLGIDMEWRTVGAWVSYGYWGDPPLFNWMYNGLSEIYFDDDRLEHYGTLATPNEFACGDWVVGIAGVQQEADHIPARALHSYPNPCRSATSIGYYMSASSAVDIRIYSIMGRLIWTYAAKEQPPGTHSVRWTGMDQHGSRVAPGVYFCLLRTGMATECDKIVVLK
jgi:transglutaminase-like putative cysteine protease